MTAIAIGKIENVPGNKGLPPQMAAHVVRALERVIELHFTDADGKPRSERVIAKGLGLSQPVLHAIRKGRGIGVHALLALRNYTGLTIDELLGLDQRYLVEEAREREATSLPSPKRAKRIAR